MSYNIPDAPWIRYADTNGVPPSRYSEYKLRYRVEATEVDGTTYKETFDDLELALDFYKQCVADNNMLTADCWSIDGDGDTVDLIECYEKEDE